MRESEREKKEKRKLNTINAPLYLTYVPNQPPPLPWPAGPLKKKKKKSEYNLRTQIKDLKNK